MDILDGNNVLDLNEVTLVLQKHYTGMNASYLDKREVVEEIEREKTYIYKVGNGEKNVIKGLMLQNVDKNGDLLLDFEEVEQGIKTRMREDQEKAW